MPGMGAVWLYRGLGSEQDDCIKVLGSEQDDCIDVWEVNRMIV